MQFGKSILNGVKWTSISTIGVALSSLIRISILTRFLNKEDFGLMAIVVFVLGVLNLFTDMGLTSAIFHKQNISRKEYASLYWVNLFFGVTLYGLIFLLSPLIASFYDQPQLTELIVIMSVTIIFAGLGNQYKTIEQKNLNFKLIAIIEIISSSLALLLAIILAVKGYGIYALVFSALLQYSLPNLVFFIRGMIIRPVLLYFNWTLASPFLKIGIFEVGSQVVNYFNRDLDILIIGKLFSAEVLGGYSLAKQLVYRPAQIINPIITKIANPLLAKFQDNIDILKTNYLKLIKIISSLNFLVYLLIIIFAPIIISILYGNNYESIVDVVRILCVYMYIRSLGNPIGSLVIATGRTDRAFYWNIFSITIMPVFIFIGSRYTIETVALSMAVGFLVLFIPNWWYLVKYMTGATLTEFLKAIMPKFFLKELKEKFFSQKLK
jgi:PST family polysaccharide transporter/teichuronic acid exporter